MGEERGEKSGDRMRRSFVQRRADVIDAAGCEGADGGDCSTGEAKRSQLEGNRQDASTG